MTQVLWLPFSTTSLLQLQASLGMQSLLSYLPSPHCNPAQLHSKCWAMVPLCTGTCHCYTWNGEAGNYPSTCGCAAAIVFSSGNVRWEHFGIFMSGVVISIITAVLINNMSDKRQYPTSWYLVNKAKRTLTKDWGVVDDSTCPKRLSNRFRSLCVYTTLVVMIKCMWYFL